MTTGLAAMTVVAAAIQTVARHSSPPIDLPDVLGMRWVDVVAGEWWRTLSGPLVSSEGWDHALLNAGGILLLGRGFERRIGSVATVGLFWLGALGALVGGIYHRDVAILLAGGSGGLMGLSGYAVVQHKQFTRRTREITVFVLIVTFAVLPALGLVLDAAHNPGGFELHLGGFVAGAAAGFGTRWARAPIGIATSSAAVLGLALVASASPALRSAPARTVSCAEARASSPEHADTRTRLQFVNETGKPLRLFWLSYRGDLKYGVAVPGEESLRRNRVSSYTHAGAAWLVTDDDGRCLVAATARTAPSIVTVRPVQPREADATCKARLDRPLRCDDR